MKWRPNLLLAAGLAALLSMPALAQDAAEVDAKLDALFGEHKTFANAFEALKISVAAADVGSVAALVRYPFRVVVDGEEYLLANDIAFIERYDGIITPEITAIITGQDYGALEVNEAGVFFGDGEVRMTPRCLERRCRIKVWLIRSIDTEPAE